MHTLIVNLSKPSVSMPSKKLKNSSKSSQNLAANPSNNRVVIATGGTGGHIFPGRALAESLAKDGFKLTIFGNKNYQKYHQNSDKFSYSKIPSSKIDGTTFGFFKASILITFGIAKSLLLILIKKPKVIIAFGGYSTFPTLIAAIILRKKIILHEQNAHLGKVNRIFAKYANQIILSFKNTDGIAKEFKDKSKFIGNPLRQNIINLSKNEYSYPNFGKKYVSKNNLGYKLILASDFEEVKKMTDEYFNILVIGGSGGAKIFSDILPKAFFNLRNELKNKINIIAQCRKDLVSSTFEQYRSFNLNITIRYFFDDIDEQIKKSHLVIARSGSSTIFELAAAKKPMILVPFAKSADNHQEKNALAIAKNGGAIVVKEQDFTINNISGIIEKLIDNPEILMRMSDEAFKSARINATVNLAKIIKEI